MGYKTTIEIDSELRDRIRTIATKNMTYSQFIEKMLDEMEKNKDYE